MKKTKRVVIVDDDAKLVARLSQTAKSAGHEVMDVCVGREDDLSVLAEKIKTFAPNVVFLDHDLHRVETGQNLAEVLGFAPKMLIGTSTAFSQNYCGQVFDDKDSAHFGHEKSKATKTFFETYCEELKGKLVFFVKSAP